MKISKTLFMAATVCAMTLFTAACTTDDSVTSDKFWTPDTNGTSGSGRAGAADGGNIDLNSNDLNLEGGNAGEYGADLNTQNGNDYTEGFGPKIEGVEFEPVYFLFDQNVILASEEAKLQAVADYLKGNDKAGVVIEGNCDSRGTTEYNRALGEKRAIAAQTFLEEQGIDASRMKTISYGKEKPSVEGETEDAFRMNRRDDLVPVYLKK